MPTEHRLLVVTESLGVGGTESHLLRLVRALVYGWNVIFSCLTRQACFVEDRGVRSSPSKIVSRQFVRYWAMLPSRRQLGHPAVAVDITHFYLPGPYVIGTPVVIAAGVDQSCGRRSLSRYQQKWPAVAH
jgi:hypothetical protein